MGFTGTVNVEMKVGSLEESVTVSGESPVVDAQSTRTVNTFDAKTLAALPSARDMWSVLAESPAVSMTRIDVGGSTAGTQTGYTVYDAQGGQARIMNDGLNTTEGNSAIGVYVDYGAFAEIATETAGHAAEFSEAGVVTQFIAKSGGNTYHGLVYADYQNKGAQSTNIFDFQATKISGARPIPGFDYQTANRLESYRDFNFDVGGYIKKDKVWWYGSYRNFDVKSRLANFPVKPFQTGMQHYTFKGTITLPANNKLIVYNQQTRKFQPSRLDSYAVGGSSINETELTTESQTHWAWVRKLEWNKVVNSSTYAEVRGGTFGYDWPLVYHPDAKGIPRVEDSSTLQVWGSNQNWIQSRDRHQILGSLSYYKENLGGDHNFKIGGEIFKETFYEHFEEDSYGNATVSVLNNGKPSRVDILEIPTVVEGGLWTYGAYVNDTWRISRRLTLVPGIRLTRYREYLPAQEHPATKYNPVATKFDEVKNVISWNNVAPRMGVTYDVFGDSKTVLKGNFSKYWYNPSVLTAINQNKSPWYKRYNWTTDLNSNGHWDPGEEGALTASQGGAADKLDPNMKNSYVLEAGLSLDRELFPNFGLHVGYVWRGIRQLYGVYNSARPFEMFNVPVQIPDPGPDGITGNGDDGPAIAGWNLDPSLIGKVANLYNNSSGKLNYHNIEVSANRRMAGRWSLMAAFAIRFNADAASGYFGNTVRQNALVRTKNDLINTDSDGLYHYTTYNFKFNSIIEGPWGVRMTPMLRFQVGQPWGRTLSYAANYGTINVLAEPLNTRRQDNVLILDLRMEKVFRLPNSRTVSAFFDVYNITNSNAEQNINYASGSRFNFPSTIVAPRILRIGTKLSW